MSELALLEVQQALYVRLNGDGVLTSLVSGIYDNVPQKTALPYVVIGDGTSNDVAAEGINLSDLRLEIEVWTDIGGRKTALTILNRLHALLHLGTLSPAGLSHVFMRCNQADTTLAEEGNRIRGTISVQIVVTE